MNSHISTTRNKRAIATLAAILALGLCSANGAFAQFGQPKGNQKDNKQDQSEHKNNNNTGNTGQFNSGQGNNGQFKSGQANGQVIVGQPQSIQVFQQPTGNQNNFRSLQGQNSGQAGQIITNPANNGGVKVFQQGNSQNGTVKSGQGSVITFGQQGATGNAAITVQPKHTVPLYNPNAGSQTLKNGQNSVPLNNGQITVNNGNVNGQNALNGHTDANNLHKDRLPKAGQVVLPSVIAGATAGATNQVLNAHGQQITLNKPAIDLNLHAGSTQKFHPDIAKPHHLDANKINLNALATTQVGNQFHLKEQVNLYKQGDVTRQLNLQKQLLANGGWNNRLVHGPVTANYMAHCYSYHYCGPNWYPSSCWLPMWSPWVSWCWWSWCDPVYDPRPFGCRPIWCQPCPPITIVQYPVFQPLYTGVCGTWIDVPAVQVANTDLQLLAVRFVDPGHPEQNLGPRYRVWLRNNSNVDIDQAFNTSLVASGNDQFEQASPQAGVRIPQIKAGETQIVDIRLPLEVNTLSVAADGQRAPFTNLLVMVDSGREIAETNDANNGANIPRDQILPVDPALFAADNTLFVAGSEVSIAGEGLGPEAGQFLVTVGNQTFQGEIEGWFDLGVRIRLPNVQLTQSVEAQAVVVRGDGAFSNPLVVSLVPSSDAKVSLLEQ